MAGGSGSRLWPVSRTAKPKQFYDLLGTGRTMLQHTFDRALSLCGGADHIRVITQSRWGDLVREQLPDLPEDHLLLEPIRKQTATATYYGLLSLAGQGPSDSVVILPCDHYVTDQERFTATLQQAIEHAMERQWIQVIGVKPTRPEPNYGYVQYVQDSEAETDVYKVKTFTDQPTPELANTFYRSGDFAWYTGIKVGSVQAFMDLYRRWMPDLVDAFAELAATPDRSLCPPRPFSEQQKLALETFRHPLAPPYCCYTRGRRQLRRRCTSARHGALRGDGLRGTSPLSIPPLFDFALSLSFSMLFR